MKKFIFIVILINLSAGFQMKIKAQDTLTWGEIFNFEVGDIFHKSGVNYGPSFYFETLWNIEVLEYNVSLTEETITCKVDVLYQTETDTLHYSYWYYVENCLSNLPSVDSIYSDPLVYNGRMINCVSDSSENDVHHTHYAQGLGSVYGYYYNLVDEVVGIQNLIYYNKSGEEWGSPLYVGFDEISDLNSNIKIFPNPASTFITIITPQNQPVEEVIIFNHLGQKALVAVPVNNTVDVSGLNAGICKIQITAGNLKKRAKLIKY